MTRRTGTYLLTALAAALAAGLAQPTAAAPAPKPPVLTGTVVISGSTTGYVSVVVPKDAVLPAGLGQDAADAVRITGGGGFAGFALASEDDDGLLIVGGHAPASAPSPERPEELLINYGAGAVGSDYAIPAGRYRLYLITGGKPTTATLRLRGLTGPAGRLKPTVPTRATVNGGPLAAASGAGQAGGVYSGGHTARTTTPFVQFYVGKLDAQAHTETAYRPCLYIGRPTGPMPYGPACASVDGADATFGAGTVFPVSDENVFGGAYYVWGGTLFEVNDGADEITQEYGGGISITTASVVRGTDYSQVWLELNAPPRAAASTRPPVGAPQNPPQQPAENTPATGPGTASETLPVTGLPTPAAALAPVLLLAGAAARRARSAR